MAKILKSLHGNQLGLGVNGRLICPSGFISGEDGSQIYMPSPSMVTFFDDFVGDVIADQYNLLEGTDSATSDAAILAGGIGGILRFTTGDAGTGLAADLVQITQALQWQASNGGLYIEGRFKLSAITTCYAYFGFTDLAATLEAPIMSASSVDTITTNASDAVGVFFDTRQSTDNWWLAGVAADVDATHQNSGFAPVADTFETWRIEVTTGGAATFFRNGKPVGTKMTGALTAATDLTPTFAVGKTSVAASMTADLDYLAIGMLR